MQKNRQFLGSPDFILKDIFKNSFLSFRVGSMKDFNENRIFENIFKNKGRRAKKLPILLHFYISLCGYLTFPQKLLKVFKF